MPSGSILAICFYTDFYPFCRCTNVLSAKLMINCTGGMKPGSLCSGNLPAKRHFGDFYADFRPTESRFNCSVKVKTLWTYLKVQNTSKFIANSHYPPTLVPHLTYSLPLNTSILIERRGEGLYSNDDVHRINRLLSPACKQTNDPIKQNKVTAVTRRQVNKLLKIPKHSVCAFFFFKGLKDRWQWPLGRTLPKLHSVLWLVRQNVFPLQHIQ